MAKIDESLLSEEVHQLLYEEDPEAVIEASNTGSNNDGFGLNNEKKNIDDLEVEICRNFVNDRCARGVTCKFRHEKSHDRNRSRSPITMSEGEKDPNNVCRDYLRNMCTRGKHCRYFHPEEGELKKAWFTPCLDFRSDICGRQECRYFHISTEDENLFKETGEISYPIVVQAMEKAATYNMANKNAKPTCKEFRQGMCNLSACRFRHIDQRQYEEEVFESLREELSLQYGPCKNNGYRYSRGNFERYRERIGPASYSDGFRGGPGLMGRGGYLLAPDPYSYARRGPSDPYSYDRRGPPDYHGGPPPVMPYSRQPEMDSYRRHSSLSPGIYSPGTTKPGNVGMEGSRDLQAEVEKLQEANKELRRDLISSKHWEQIYIDTKSKVQSLQVQNQELVDKIAVQSKQILGFDSKTQTFDTYKSFVKELGYKLKKQMLVVETELSELWGGGPPPSSSQREAWSHLQSLPSELLGPPAQTSDERGGRRSCSAAGDFPASYKTGETFDALSTSGAESSNYSQSKSNPDASSRGRMDNSSW